MIGSQQQTEQGAWEFKYFSEIISGLISVEAGVGIWGLSGGGQQKMGRERE